MEKLNRLEKMNEFVLKKSAQEHYTLTPLATDASSRKYYRVSFTNGKTAVVMDDEGCRCRTHEFVTLSKFLRRRGAYVPEVFASDFKNGFLLIEDLGDSSISKLLTDNNETQLYLSAASALSKVTAITERPKCAEELSKRKILDDLQLFTDWYYPMAVGQILSPQARKDFFNIIEQLSSLAYQVPNRLVLWDYHIDNVMVPKNSKECAIIDFQDALWGPLTYDIMSLLAADRRTASDTTINMVKEAFFKTLTGVSREDFEDSYAFLSLFRHLRVLGRFTTLSMINGKKHYLQYICQIWERIDSILKYPKLEKIKQWMTQYILPEQRTTPVRKPIYKAMVLAAGRGIRMRELSLNQPKPLIQVGGKSLIDYNFERLIDFGINDIVVNLCYKGEMIKEHLLKHYPHTHISFSTEEEALETGGGVKHALPLLKDSVFFVLNSDVFLTDRGYKPILWRMLDAWNEEKYDIILLLQDKKDVCGDKSIGDYRITSKGEIERNKEKTSGYPYMFAGISIINKKIFNNQPLKKFSLRDCFDMAQQKGRLGFVVNEGELFHVGTPEALKAAETKIHR